MRYNSWDRNFKAPFGALKISQNATIKVKVNKNFNVYSIKLIIEKEDENLKPVIYMVKIERYFMEKHIIMEWLVNILMKI